MIFPHIPCSLFFTTFQVSRVPASQWIWHHSLTPNTHSLDFFTYSYVSILYSSPSLSKASVYNVGDPGSIPRSGRSPGEGDGNSLQFLPGKSHGWRILVGYSPWGCKSRTQLSDFTFTFTFLTLNYTTYLFVMIIVYLLPLRYAEKFWLNKYKDLIVSS